MKKSSPLDPIKPLRKICRKLIRPSLDAWVKQELNLLPISQTEPGDVFIVGYPKSGHTWLQNLGAGLLYGIAVASAPDTLIQDLVPDVHDKRYYKRYSPVMLFKSHDTPLPRYRRVVYIVRDGRDVLVSYLHYVKNLTGQAVDPVAAARSGEGLNCVGWQDHVEQWLSNPHGADMLIIKYEDLLEDAVAQLDRLAKFMNLERTSAELKQVAAGASFDNMRRNEVRFGWDNRTNFPKDKFFVRRGIAGSYKDELDPKARHVFEEVAGASLHKLGYL